MRRKPALAFLRPDFPLDDAGGAGAGGGAGGRKKAEAPKWVMVVMVVGLI